MVDTKQAKPLTCIMLGEQSLLIQCADIWLKAGNQILCIVADDPAIADWCEKNAVTCHPWQKDLDQTLFQQTLQNPEFDYLFSITNLRMLPDSLLQRPKQGAINFHDGPLPRYAGLNVPAWALMHREQNHGVTFHVMTNEADKGDILEQKLFPIVPGETAFTLNAKCYQFASEAFAELVTKLGAGELQPTPQDFSQRSYFGLDARPPQAGILNFTREAAELDAQIRAVNYGPYRTPLDAAKLWLGHDYLMVREAVSETADSGAAPGEILAISTDGLLIACKEGAIRLTELQDRSGQRVCPVKLAEHENWQPGSPLPALEAAVAESIDQCNKDYARYETYWSKRLQQLEPVELPFGQVHPERSHASYQHADMPLPDALGTLTQHGRLSGLTAFAALYLSRIGGKADFDLTLQTQAIAQLTANTQNLFARLLPLKVSIGQQQSVTDYLAAFDTSLQALETRGTHASDLFIRDPDLHHVQHCEAFPVALLQSASLADAPDLTQLRNELVLIVSESDQAIRWAYNPTMLSEADIARMQEQFLSLLADGLQQPDKPVSQLALLSASDRTRIFDEWNNTDTAYDRDACVHHLFEQQAEKQPQATAFVFENETVTYQALNERANQLARLLTDRGAGQGKLVGVLVDRSIDMIVSLLAVLKSGSAYVPLDPVYPRDRLSYMVEDSGAVLVITHDKYQGFLPGTADKLVMLESEKPALAAQETSNLSANVPATELAYTIYTSGSTGKPKGVMVEHRNVLNFFAGMDQRIDRDDSGEQPGVWLAVTSISFDISVLEIFWTLAHGFKVVLYADDKRQKTDQQKLQSALPDQDMEFSLFYWNVAKEEDIHNSDKYSLLIDGAKFADSHQFKAVWTPERHFAAFGGLYPNPAITGAAIATITENIDIRAGSCVVPLHSPIRVAEEWAVVDNLSNGRVGMAIAAGWAPPDFAIKPENYANAKEVMFDSIETVQKLWAGERVSFPGPTGEVSVRTLPRPVQKQLPVWITTAGNADNYRRAGAMGANVLTHLLGQTVEEVGEKIEIYRQARREAGHPGNGTVTLMLHTFVGQDRDEVREKVHGPLKEYLKSAMFLVKDAAWNFPTFKKMSEETGKTLDEFFENIADEDMDALLEFAFQRYFNTSGLFGTLADCVAMVDKCKAVGVGEIACLIDFGIDSNLVVEHLPYLNQVRELCVKQAIDTRVASDDYTIPALMANHNVTHFQCTPSMATMLAADAVSRQQLGKLKQMMVGGEAFPTELAQDLHGLVPGKVTNMYGPTEATVWSSTYDLEGEKGTVSIGHPIANTQIYIVDENLQQLPVGVPGELIIAGDGVVRGYHNRPELTAERFVKDHFSQHPDARMYRTGDLAKYQEDGRLAYLSRIDHQVKIRGYRIELGEIEALLAAHDSVREAVVLLREDIPGDKRLVAYLRPRPGKDIDSDTLRSYLAAELPEFMVPSIYVPMKAMPLTPNGKTDRKALPAPQSQRRAGADMVVPQNDTEALIADIWKAALGVDAVGIKDNFFDIGGHSLLVIQILKDLNNHESVTKAVQMTDLFRFTTIESLARFLEADSDDSNVVETSQARAASRKAAMARRRKGRRR